jgi:hypothetical protein
MNDTGLFGLVISPDCAENNGDKYNFETRRINGKHS